MGTTSKSHNSDKVVLIDLPDARKILSRNNSMKKLKKSNKQVRLARASMDNLASFSPFASSDTITTARSTTENDLDDTDLHAGEDSANTMKSPQSLLIKPSSSSRLLVSKHVRFPDEDHEATGGDADSTPSAPPLATILGTSCCSDMPATWWSPREIMYMQDQAYAVVDFYAKYRVEYTAAVRELVSACATSDAQPECLRTHSAFSNIHGSPACRGLETGTVEVLQHRRDLSRKRVLHKQGELKDRSISREQQSVILAVLYEQTARYATLWARTLAEMDIYTESSDGVETRLLSESIHK